MKLSLSGFLFEDGYKTQSVSIDEFVETAVEAGYQGVELRATQVSPEAGPKVTESWRKATTAAGLAVTCIVPRYMPPAGAGRDAWLSGYLDIAAALSCPLLKLSGDVEWTKKAAETAAGYGVGLAVNTHIRSRTETVATTLEYVHAVNQKNFGVLYDSMHLMVAEEDYVNAIDHLYPFLRGVLIQGGRPLRNSVPQARSFEKIRIHEPGGQDWTRVMRSLQRLGYSGWITVIENGWPEPFRKRIAFETAQSLRELWNDLYEPKDTLGRDHRRRKHPVLSLNRDSIAAATPDRKPVLP